MGREKATHCESPGMGGGAKPQFTSGYCGGFTATFSELPACDAEIEPPLKRSTVNDASPKIVPPKIADMATHPRTRPSGSCAGVFSLVDSTFMLKLCLRIVPVLYAS